MSSSPWGATRSKLSSNVSTSSAICGLLSPGLECRRLGGARQALPVTLLERIEVGGDLEPRLDRAGDDVEELQAAEHDRAGNPSVLDDEFAITAGAAVGQDDCVCILPLCLDGSDRQQVDPRHLEP